MEIVYLDTETTGWPWEGAEILELAIIDSNNQTLFNKRFLPIATSWPEAEKIHGIAPSDVAQCQPFKSYVPELAELLSNKTVVCYNAEFDRSAIEAEFQALKSRPVTPYLATIDTRLPTTRWECAMLRFAPFYGQWNEYHESYTWTSLLRAASFCKHIWHKTPHGALADCRATRTVWQWMDRQSQPELVITRDYSKFEIDGKPIDPEQPGDGTINVISPEGWTCQKD